MKLTSELLKEWWDQAYEEQLIGCDGPWTSRLDSRDDHLCRDKVEDGNGNVLIVDSRYIALACPHNFMLLIDEIEKQREEISDLQYDLKQLKGVQ